MDSKTITSRRLYTASIDIDAPAAQVFDYLKEPTKSWAGMGVRVHDVTPTPVGVGTSFAWEDKMFGFHVSGTNEITEFVPNELLVVTASKGFIWRFELQSHDQATTLTIGVDDLPSNWPRETFDAVATKLSGGGLDAWLADTKATVESGVARHRQVDRHLVLTLSVTIHAPVEAVYPFLTDPHAALGSCPGTRVTDVVTAPEVVGTTLRWHSRILGVPASVAMEYIATVPSDSVVIRSDSGFVQTWTLQPVEDGTRLTLALENEFSGPIGGLLRSTMLRQGDTSTDAWLESFAALVEERATA